MKMFQIFLLLCFPVLLISCSEDNGTTSKQVPFPQSVSISIGGQNVTNTAINSGMGNSTLFVARPSRVEPGLTVWVKFKGSSMMSTGSGMFQMYDDGTHGDRIPGDGEYCFENFNEAPRMHMGNAMSGHYTFEFYCQDSNGNHSSHNNAWVDVN